MAATILHDSPFYKAGGNLSPDDPCYIYRPADEELFNALLDGQYCYVLTSRQMGKSSLMHQTAVRLRDRAVIPVLVDLTSIGTQVTLEQWYLGILIEIARQLSLTVEMRRYWDENTCHSPLYRFTHALTDVVLASTDAPLAIFIDEIDCVTALNKRFSTDEFFAAIRQCFNSRASSDEMERLTFCLLGVSTPAELIQDPNTTPFNIGRQIELTDFTLDEAVPLATRLDRNAPAGRRKLERVLWWTGGHPYLTQKLCLAVCHERSCSVADVDRICARLFFTYAVRTSEDNLVFVHRLLRASEQSGVRVEPEGSLSTTRDPISGVGVMMLYRSVIDGRRVPNDPSNPTIARLHLAGVVRSVNGFLRSRNRIYAHVFDRKWVNDNLPDAEMRRHREAFRRGVLRTTAVSSILLLAMGMLVAEAVVQRNRALRSAYDAASSTANALQSAREARQAETHARQETFIARASTIRANAAAARALHSDKVARMQSANALIQRQAADRQRVIAEQQASAATAERNIALKASMLATASSQQNAHLLKLANLRLAADTWNSDGGSPQSVENLLEASREGRPGDPQRFEWRYQWSLLHGQSAATLVAKSTDITPVQMSVTPRGRLVTLDAAHQLAIDDISSGHIERHNLPALISGYSWGSLTTDGSRLVVTHVNGVIDVRDVATLRVRRSWRGANGNISCLHLSPDGKALFGYCEGDNTVRCWDIESGRRTVLLPAAKLLDSGLLFDTVAVSNGCKLVAIASAEKTIITDLSRLLDRKYAPAVVTSFESGVTDLQFASTKSTLFACDFYGNVAVTDAALISSIASWKTDNPVYGTCLACTPDGREVAVGSRDGTIRLYSVAGGTITLQRVIKGHTSAIASLRFAPGSRWVASSDVCGTVHAWDLEAHDAYLSIPVGSRPTELTYSSNSRFLSVSMANGSGAIYNCHTGQATPYPQETTGGTTYVRGLAYSPDQHKVATFGFLKQGQSIHTFVHIRAIPSGTIRASWTSAALERGSSFDPGTTGWFLPHFAPDGKTIAVVWNDDVPRMDYNGKVLVFDAASGRHLATIQTPDGAIGPVEFSPKGDWLIFRAATSGIAYRVSSRTWTVAARLTHAGGVIMSTRFSPDGRLLAVGDEFGRIDLWNALTWRLSSTLSGQSSPIRSLAISPDEQTLASGDDYGVVKLWDIGSGCEVRTMSQGQRVHRLEFSSDGTQLACAQGRTIVIWRAAAPKILQTQPNTRAVNSDVTDRWMTSEDDRRAEATEARQIEQHRMPSTDGHEVACKSLLSNTGWKFYLESASGAQAGNSVNRAGIITCHITRPAPLFYYIQAYQPKIPLRSGGSYIVQFRARSTRQSSVMVSVTRDVAPFDLVGLSKWVNLDSQWKAFRFRFDATRVTPDHGDLTFGLGSAHGDVQFADVQLAPVDAR